MSILDTVTLNGVDYSLAGGSGGGQPKAITLASQMTDTEVLYLYLGEETGYDYGYIYAYIGNAWTKTTLYGKGQDGQDGQDGTATDAQVETYVEAWLDEHPEATTTVQDGSITKVKLSEDVLSEVSGYKTTDKSSWLLTFTDETEGITVLEHTRIYQLQEQEYSGSTTYLIPNNVIESLGVSAFGRVSGPTFNWYGYYTQSENSRTYATNISLGFFEPRSDYTGIAITIGNNKSLNDVAFMKSISIITTKKSSIDIPGFSGYEHEDVCFAGRMHNSLVKIAIKVEPYKIYAINMAKYSTYRPLLCNYFPNSSIDVETGASFAVLGDYIIMASVDGYIAICFEPNKDLLNLYNSNGLEMYILDKPWEIKALRDKNPCRSVLHAGNQAHNLLLAFALGWSGAECDVRKTLDDVWVLYHEASVGGVTIANVNYSELKSKVPYIMTVEQLIEAMSYFWGLLEFDFHHLGTAMSGDERWEILKKGIKAPNIDHFGYYIGDSGMVGSETAKTFYQHGLVYGYTDGTTIPPDIHSMKYLIGSTGGTVEQNPQTYFFIPAFSKNSGYVTNKDLRTTYKDYFHVSCYLNKKNIMYNSPCESLTLSSNELVFTGSQTKKLTPLVYPINCSDEIEWTSSNSNVATVTKTTNNNMLNPPVNIASVGNGECVITATCGDVIATCTITVSGV